MQGGEPGSDAGRSRTTGTPQRALAGGSDTGVGGEYLRHLVLDEAHDGLGGFRQLRATTDRPQRDLQRTHHNTIG